MRSYRFRPLVEGLEERMTPATAGDLYAQTVMASEFLGRTADFNWMFGDTYRPWVVNLTSSLYQAGTSPLLGQLAPDVQGMAQAFANFAVTLGSSMGIQVAPTPGPPAAPEAPEVIDSEGMTNKMPDVNDPAWGTPTASGLKIWDVVQGTGNPVPNANATITARYTGWLAANGKEFDNARTPKTPLTSPLTGLIQGWQEGVVGMKPGGIRRLYIPSSIGYGTQGKGASIPPNSNLVFEIKLVSFT